MLPFKELVKTETYNLITIQLKLYNLLKEYMDSNELNFKQAAKKMKVSKKTVKSIYNCTFNEKLETYVKILVFFEQLP